jgi:uncharacterized protein YxjI
MGFRHRGLDGPTFQMRQKMMAIGDDFWIEDDAGNKVFKVNGKALRMRETFILEDTRATSCRRSRRRSSPSATR